ncbi:hypothetical protein M2451_002500 [Dysgonomonas sp. PFB1-18]|uniref:hypothetical protein n=1 Tax=unclassified Dysgonomonas TaxID=2630389 RepID=UPI002475355C|nr:MULTISPECIES: hypothetical protein [unclassified Dysgonomonas]MDH6307981.1 hypothetical protein [Dysgonomonas sp. PF1-14]MDH6339520.1 hypothetical protein [Dysgonomonas sp. PF1-16]MDH6381171.1 hypothetical protein [Dysgonomonas sp. PFB1-18]MDH6398383.1 hypothetical protein [Dysgonomonas sp. PF1-23]
MEKYNRIVIELYKKCFSDHINGKEIDENVVSEAQKELNFAIDKAKVHNEPTDELESLKEDINHLKYNLL